MQNDFYNTAAISRTHNYLHPTINHNHPYTVDSLRYRHSRLKCGRSSDLDIIMNVSPSQAVSLMAVRLLPNVKLHSVNTAAGLFRIPTWFPIIAYARTPGYAHLHFGLFNFMNRTTCAIASLCLII